jgi:uncharacterized membrane protein HdeD (DUF308 family)
VVVAGDGIGTWYDAAFRHRCRRTARPLPRRAHAGYGRPSDRDALLPGILMEVPMFVVLARNWSLVVLRGVAAVLFGLLTLFMPAISLAVLILLFGAFAFVDGVFTIVSAIRDRRGDSQWVALLIGGILGVGVGIVTLLMPDVTALVLLYLIAAWAIVTGVAEIVAAVRLRRIITREWLLVVAGVISVAFGVLLVAFPSAGALAVTLWIGAYAFVLGIVLIALGLRLRRWDREQSGEAMLRAA